MDKPEILHLVNEQVPEDVLEPPKTETVEVLIKDGARGRSTMFTVEQKEILMRYFEEYGMTSTHRKYLELITRCAEEVGTTVERVKNWIGSEAVKRKRKAGILPRPKIEIAGSEPQPKLVSTPPAKKIKRVNGYNLFFSHTVRTRNDVGTEFKERNAKVAVKWAELSEDERKEWAAKAEAACASSVQEMMQPALLGLSAASSLLSPAVTLTSDLSSTSAADLIEKTLQGIQERLEILEQLGLEGYCILVNTNELQTHTLGTSKGKAFHKMRQHLGKPLENPFIGHVFSEDSDLGLNPSVSLAPKRQHGILTPPNSVDTMQKSVLNAFALKYKVATGRSEVPYGNLDNLGVQVYGMPRGIPFHNPMLYSQQQLQQILANQEKIVFLKVGPQSLSDGGDPLTEVELTTDTLVTSGHDLHIGAEEKDIA